MSQILSKINKFLLFCYYIYPWKRAGSSFHLNSLHLRIVCAKFGWNWPSGSGKEDKKKDKQWLQWTISITKVNLSLQHKQITLSGSLCLINKLTFCTQYWYIFVGKYNKHFDYSVLRGEVGECQLNHEPSFGST